MARQGWCIVLLLCTLLGGCSMCNAAFIGCFRFNTASLTQQTLDVFSNAASGNSTTACEELCSRAKQPIAASIGGKCYCSSLIPDHKDKLEGFGAAQCAADDVTGEVDDLQAVALHYIHRVAGEACALAPLEWDSRLWLDRDQRRDANFSSLADGFTLDSAGYALKLGVTQQLGAVKASSKDKWAFGFYQLTVQPYGPGVGAVTAFYTSSNDQHSKTGDKWDEIDIEFVNALGPTYPGFGPNTVWLNIWSDGKNFSTVPHTPETVQAVTGDESFITSARMATYSFDWQPDYVRWYIEGEPLMSADRLDWLNNTFPTLPSNVIVSLWIPDGFCEFFGGCNTSAGPYESTMASIRRVVCGSPEDIAALALSPTAGGATRPPPLRQAPPTAPVAVTPGTPPPPATSGGGSGDGGSGSGSDGGSGSGSSSGGGGGSGGGSVLGNTTLPPISNSSNTVWRPVGLQGMDSTSGAAGGPVGALGNWVAAVLLCAVALLWL